MIQSQFKQLQAGKERFEWSVMKICLKIRCAFFLVVPPPLPVKELPSISGFHPCRPIHGNSGFLSDSLDGSTVHLKNKKN